MTVVEIKPKAERLERLRRIMHEAVDSALEGLGEQAASFAMVTWDMVGQLHTSFGPDVGPIGRPLIPVLCMDALSRHVTVAEAFPDKPNTLNGDDGA